LSKIKCMRKVFMLLAILVLCGNMMQAQELPAIAGKNGTAFFIPSVVCEKYKLEPAQGDAWMKVYNNLSDKAVVQRVNDIRWQATNKAAATEWYNNNGKMLNEGGHDITGTVAKPAGVDAWNVYEASEEMKSMMEAMGVKQNQYTFTFTVDKYVAKIFVGVPDDKNVMDAWKFAKEGVKAALKAAGKPKLAALLL
jgi:hypothetical protein